MYGRPVTRSFDCAALSPLDVNIPFSLSPRPLPRNVSERWPSVGSTVLGVPTGVDWSSLFRYTDHSLAASRLDVRKVVFARFEILDRPGESDEAVQPVSLKYLS